MKIKGDSRYVVNDEFATMTVKIMFVCHGNICRSPMAEFIFKDLAKKKGIADHFLVASSATSRKKFETESAIRSIRRQKPSLKDMGCPVAASARFNCKRATMTNTICSSAWTAQTSVICSAFSAAIRRERCIN